MSMGMELRTHIRPGRPRLTRARRRDGRSAGELPDAVRAVAKAQRVRAGAPPDDALNALRGYALGVLRVRELISADQFRAGERYRDCVVSYCRLMGIPSPSPRALDMDAIGGRSLTEEPSDEAILQIRRRFSDCRRVLLDAGRDLGFGARVNATVYRICIEDPPIGQVGAGEVVYLGYGLSALERLFK